MKKILSVLMCFVLIISTLVLVSVSANATTYSGSCGDDLTWSLDTSTGVLDITGSGDMTNYSIYSSDYAPWYSKANAIKTVTIADGVTSIGEYAFFNCDLLADIYYNGSEQAWNEITIGEGNDYLTNATIYYNYGNEEVENDPSADDIWDPNGAEDPTESTTTTTVPEVTNPTESTTTTTVPEVTNPTESTTTTTVPEVTNPTESTTTTTVPEVTNPTESTTTTTKPTEATNTTTLPTTVKPTEPTKQPTTQPSTKPVHAHVYSEKLLEKATCTKNGTMAYICSCGDMYTKEIAKKAHEVVLDKGYAATCEKTGLTQGSHCSACGEVIIPQKEIEKREHAFVNKTEKATYFKNGSTKTACSSCGYVSKSVVEKKLNLKVPKFKLAKGKKQFKVKYTKVKDATGFQVRYKLKGKWKVKTFNSKKTVTKVIKKLKKGNYQVQVRAMIKQDKQKVYSAWSKTKKVKVK